MFHDGLGEEGRRGEAKRIKEVVGGQNTNLDLLHMGHFSQHANSRSST